MKPPRDICEDFLEIIFSVDKDSGNDITNLDLPECLRRDRDPAMAITVAGNV